MKRIVSKKKNPKVNSWNNRTIETEYLSKVYSSEYLNLIKSALKILKNFYRKHRFDAIAFRGSSGAAFAYPLSYLMQIPLIHVRKGGSHYHSIIEGVVDSKKYVIIDDFIETGRTIKKITSSIKKEIDKGAQPLAIFLYADSKSRTTYQNIPIIKIKRSQ